MWQTSMWHVTDRRTVTPTSEWCFEQITTVRTATKLWHVPRYNRTMSKRSDNNQQVILMQGDHCSLRTGNANRQKTVWTAAFGHEVDDRTCDSRGHNIIKVWHQKLSQDWTLQVWTSLSKTTAIAKTPDMNRISLLLVGLWTSPSSPSLTSTAWSVQKHQHWLIWISTWPHPPAGSLVRSGSCGRSSPSKPSLTNTAWSQ